MTTPSDKNREAPGARLQAPLLLLVDDMAEIGLIVERLGRRSGHAVVHCKRADTAWEYLRDHVPDLVLLDVNLPGMNGLELCRRIRLDERLAEVPVAILGSGMLPEDVAQARQAGATAVLFKDLLAQPDIWQRRIEEILNGREKWRELGAE